MLKLINYWQVQVFDIDNNQPIATGYQRDKEPEFANGFIILRDMKGTTLTGFRIDQIAAFKVSPVYKQEK
ncbi:hypothetical protein [Serratia quinivorans]|uniref:hypothetical protein n=1 Tax=Serratia quinivorans TaxID=137545 RepID=UPI003F9B3AE8